MSTLLFWDIPRNDSEVMKSLKMTKTLSTVMCVFSVGLGVACVIDAFSMEPYRIENVFLALFMPLVLLVLFVALRICEKHTQYQYLLVYQDMILYRKGFSKVEHRIAFDPRVCKIRIKRYLTRGGYTNYLIFLDENNRCILRYALSFSYSDFQQLKRKLRHIGCQLIYSNKYK